MTKHPTTHPATQPAHFDRAGSTIIIEQMTIRDTDVIREAHRWTTGERGPLIEDPDQLAECDLTNYVTEALRIGAHALSVTGQAYEARALEHLLKDLGDRTADSAHNAAQTAGRAAANAAKAVTKAANDAKQAIIEVDTRSRKEFTATVSRARRHLDTELRRIFGGENPELFERLKPLLDKFGTELDRKVIALIEELLAKAAKQFDPTDPASPMAKHSAELRDNQEKLVAQLTRSHVELTHRIEELSTAVKIQEAKTTLAKATPIKGISYADQIHTLMHGIAAGLGDEYADTSATTGLLPRCKKGDGVLTFESGTARLVIEVTDSARAGWGDYLDQAERNRKAIGSLGLARTPAQNGEQTIRRIGPRRIVMAFDPAKDNPELLRIAVMFLRAEALTAAAPTNGYQTAIAEEKIQEALTQLTKIDTVKKMVGAIQQNAAKIDSECVSLSSCVRRLLDEALIALTGTEPIRPTMCTTHDLQEGHGNQAGHHPIPTPR